MRALIAHTNRGGEARLRKLEQRLLAAGVTVSRTADDLLRYHAKFMVADSVLHLFGFNFTKLDIEQEPQLRDLDARCARPWPKRRSCSRPTSSASPTRRASRIWSSAPRTRARC